MFQPETEDMLPRMAPTPSAPIPMGCSDAIIRPQVPEVSILYGQQDANAQQQLNSQMHQEQQNKNNTQTYAAWKKQMLPKVAYPASAMAPDTYLSENTNKNNTNMRDCNMPRSNLYPLRSTNIPPNLAMPPLGGQTNAFGISDGGTNPLSYRRSLESYNNNAFQQIQHQPYQRQQQSPRQILPITASSTQGSTNASKDILTICAGTQTDATIDSSNIIQGFTDLSNLASKQDLDNVLQLVQDMRHEQLRIVKMLETLLFYQQQPSKPETRDVFVQVDIQEKENRPIVNGGCILPEMAQQSAATNKFIQHLKPSPNTLQLTPKGKPIAQSTTYRPNSPQTQRLQEIASAPAYSQSSNVTPTLTKSSSDTSIAMNELALKYLPNEKLVELLNELNMDCPQPATQNHLQDPSVAVTNNPITPNCGNKENFDKGPSDISNASYKYLKKYRLLPEDHVAGQDVESGENFNDNHQNTPQYNTPQRQQYNNMRNSPINHRQTPPSLPPPKCSPYAGRLPLSPLARATAPSTPQHIVNLENIKYQPKFL